jgi:hypothetical protein
MSNPTSSRINWLDEHTQLPVIEQHARKLTSFVDALADGKVDDAEVKAQEARLIALMKEIEPKLDDALHAKVTDLLCEVTAYDLMRMLNQMQQTRPKTKFRG